MLGVISVKGKCNSMKNFYFFPIILISTLIAATVHYIEYQSLQPKYDDFCPDNIPCFHDYEKGLKAAQKWRKPIAVFFTGWATSCCGAFEERLFGDEIVQQLLTEKYVLVTLFVDGRDKLPHSEHFEHVDYKGRKRRITTTGEKWQQFKIHCFHKNVQPLFALLSPNEELLQQKTLVYAEIEEIKAFFEAGLYNFQNGIIEGKLKCSC